MPYATNTDVALEFKSIDLANGSVKAATVDEWCNQASNQIDAAIAGKYVVPVTLGSSPKAFSILKMICIQLVVPRLAAAVGTQTGVAKASQAPGSGKGAAGQDPVKAAKDMLKDIQSGAMQLSDAPLASAADGVESYTNDNAATLQPPKFKRGGNNW